MSLFIRKISYKMILAALLVVGLGSSLLSILAPVPVSAALSSEAADLNDTTRLTAFIDGIMKVEMDSYKIPGAVISIVKDGELLFAKGYGHSNIEKGAPVDPETSLFRIASTTKLFTWTAVMQLVEQGKIDLDTDINTYLKSVKIPNTYKEPITMRHLMTHTAGFEEGGVGYQITTDPKKLPGSISETLNKHMLARVKPPGEMMSYSNYGATLAGLIVEEVSGISYDDYIQQNIFEPLDMKYATVHEPIPAALEPYEVLGYAKQGSGFVAMPPTFEAGFRPAGSGSVSAVDMAHFMIAHLKEGRYGDKQMLKPETAELMHSPAFQFDKRLPAMALGFEDLRKNGQRVLSHGGADTMFSTEFYLIPEKQIGIFVSFSGGDGGAAALGLFKDFFDRYLPAPEAVKLPPVSPELEKDVQKYAGAYQFTRRNHSDIDKFFSFLAQMNIGVEDNKLVIGSGAEQEVFVPIEPNLFQQVGGTGKLAFRTDDSGKVTHMFLDFLPSMPLERTPLFNQMKFWFPLLGISAVLFLTALIGFVYRRREINAMPKAQKWAVRLSAATAAWALLTIAGTFVIMNMDLLDRLSQITPTLIIYLFMPVIFVILTVASIALSVLAWKNNYWTVLKRVHYTLVALSALTLSLFFYHWNLLGWQFG